MQAFRKSNDQVVLDLLCKRFRTPFSKTDLQSRPKAEEYSSSTTYSKDWLLYNYRRKLLNSDKALEESRDLETVKMWEIAEKQCFSTNQRLNRVVENDFLNSVRDKIASVIGWIPPVKLCTNGRWSNGATALTKRGTHFSVKMKGSVAVTHGASGLAPFFFSGLDRYDSGVFMPEFFGEFHIVRSNRCVQVPKTSDVNRMIACEPAANAFMQQAVGRHIRSCLKKVANIDLNDQTVNQDAAFRAVFDDLATLDLSMASDTLSLSLVEHVVPKEWLTLLKRLRCTHSDLNGRTILLEKFSSMGNGFTF
jgi:hypothetical protein